MYNHYVDYRRRFARRQLIMVDESRLPGQSIESLSSSTGNLHDALWAERMQLLQQALDMLGENHRLALLLHDVEGYKLAEISEITGDPVGTVKSRLHRARQRLREILPDEGTF
jgi:RNA polymerase sigma-70 factor (ECF subfamily)